MFHFVISALFQPATMSKLAFISLMFFGTYTNAQQFNVELPNKKKIDDFTYKIVAVLNDAPFNFSHLKGKLITKSDSVHLKSDIYQSKISLPDATASRYVQDSTKYVEYFFGEFEKVEEAKEAFEELTATVARSLSKKVVLLTNDWGNDANTVIENKMAYTQHNGFFHYNICIQVNKIPSNGKWRLVLQFYSGRPNYYYWIAKNEPIGSFNFVKIIKSNRSLLFRENQTTCPVELPPLTCAGTKVLKDTSYVIYSKTGFAGLINARSEYDAFFGAMRAGLGSEYVYFLTYSQPPVLKRIAFVKFDDIDKGKRNTIYISLVEKPNIGITNPYKKEYEMLLSFGY